jgi:hypothetical protein
VKRIFIIKPGETELKREAQSFIGQSTKAVRIEICDYRPRRTDRQNRLYWPTRVKPFADWLGEQYGVPPDEDRAHRIFKDTFLRVPECNPMTGETMFDLNGDPMMRTRSTRQLNTEEFSMYLDQCDNLLEELCGIIQTP